MNKKGIAFLIITSAVLAFTSFYYFPRKYNFFDSYDVNMTYTEGLDYIQKFEVNEDTNIIFTNIVGFENAKVGITDINGNEIFDLFKASQNNEIIKVPIKKGKYSIKYYGKGNGEKVIVKYSANYKRFDITFKNE